MKPRYSEIEGEIVGIFTGDGGLYFWNKNYSYDVSIYFGKKNIDYAFYVMELFERYFKKKFKFKKVHASTIKLYTKSKEIHCFFHHYLDFEDSSKCDTVKLKEISSNKKFLVGFLRGLLDTDGCIHVRKDNGSLRITYCTTSEELSKQIKTILSGFKIKSSISLNIRNRGRNEKPTYYVSIWKRDVDTFLKLVDPYKLKKFRARGSGVECCIGSSFV